MNDPNVVSALQSFYSGFPGSAAALQGSKRFTTPLKETQALRTDILQELGKTVDPSPEGLCSRFASNLTQTAASVVLLSAFDLLRRQRHTFARCPAWAPELGVRGGHGLQRAGQLAVPSLRMQTNGHRHVDMLPVEKLSLYIQSCQKGQRPSYKDLLSFVSSVQPQTLASYLSMFPNEIQHGILSKHTLAYVPPGWLLMEKVFFA